MECLKCSIVPCCMKAVRDITDGSSRTVCTRGIGTEVVKGEDVSAGGAWSWWMCDSI